MSKICSSITAHFSSKFASAFEALAFLFCTVFLQSFDFIFVNPFVPKMQKNKIQNLTLNCLGLICKGPPN